MLSPTHPARFFVSYHGRRFHRALRDGMSSTQFAELRLKRSQPFTVIEHKSPIFRVLRGVRVELQAGKRRNLELVLPSFDGLILEPGETFSFWKRAGIPSPKRGFRPGLVIQGGKPMEGIGGGLCQLSNALFWCALHSDLSVVERHRHSFDLFPDDNRNVPFGLGASVAYGLKDLRFTNSTNVTYQISAELRENELCVALRASAPVNSYKVEERDSRFYRRDSTVFRKNKVVRTNQKTQAEEILFTNDFECRYDVAPELIRNSP